MASISAHSAALTLLQKMPATTAVSESSPTNTILQIVADVKTAKAAEAAATKPPIVKTVETAETSGAQASGALISAVTSGADLAALGKIVTATTLANAPTETAASVEATSDSADPSWDAAADDAENRALWVIQTAVGINGKFYLQEHYDYDASMAKIEVQRVTNVASGMSEDKANEWAERSIRNFPSLNTFVDMGNNEALRASSALSYAIRGREAWAGVSGVISTDDTGRASVKAFEMRDAEGLKLLSLSEDGTLTTYNRDGTIRSEKSQAEVLRSTFAGEPLYNTSVRRSEIAANAADLY